jgi:hypothetical protein
LLHFAAAIDFAFSSLDLYFCYPPLLSSKAAMSMFRSAFATARSSGAAPLRSSVARQVTRSFASEAPKPVQQAAQAASGSNLPLILGLGGVGGLGAWYYMGGFDGQVKKPEVSMPKALQSGALSKSDFKEFTLKEVKPYNHDSST